MGRVQNSEPIEDKRQTILLFHFSLGKFKYLECFAIFSYMPVKQSRERHYETLHYMLGGSFVS